MLKEPQSAEHEVAGQAPRSERRNHLSGLWMRMQQPEVPPLPADEALWLLQELDKLETEIERNPATYDANTDTLTVHGIKVAVGLWAQLAESSIGSAFRIIARDTDGTLILQSVQLADKDAT